MCHHPSAASPEAQILNAAHERHKMVQAARRFWDAMRGYIRAVRQERRQLAPRSIGFVSLSAPLEGFPILRLAGAILGLSAAVLILKVVQS